MSTTGSDKDRQIQSLQLQLQELEQRAANLEIQNTKLSESLKQQLSPALPARSDSTSTSWTELDIQQVVVQQILESMQDMILVKDEKSKIVYANRAFREYYGMSMEQLRGIIDTPVNKQEWTAQYLIDDAYVIKTGNTLTIDEEPVTRYDGTVRYFNTIKTPIFSSESGRNHSTGTEGAAYMVAVARDITEKKEIERRVSEFNSMVSHELRTPLTAIRASLGLLEGDTTEENLSETNAELITIARTECDRMIRLINDLLDIKKIAASQLLIRMTPITAEEVVGPVVASMSKVAEECLIDLKAEITDDRSFSGDRDRIIQVLANLVSNAIKFSPQNTRVTIEASRATDSAIRFSVRDRGPGIASDDFEKLFIPYQQLDSSDSRAKGGTGLGLAISKAIVERHNGHIGFSTTAGDGATFYFDLPVLRLPDDHENLTPTAHLDSSSRN